MGEEIDIRDITPPDAFAMEAAGDPIGFPILVILATAYLCLVAFAIVAAWWAHRQSPRASLRRRTLRDIVALERSAESMPASQWTAGLAGIVRGYIHQSRGGSIPFETREETVARLGTDDSWTQRLTAFLTTCDRWRYAGSEFDAVSRGSLMREAVNLVKEGP